MDRMPIACVHCAKAKAKCDKKVPCTRCVGKQISCQSRATRRASQHSSRRNITKSVPNHNIRSSAAFQNPRGSQDLSQNRQRPFLTSQGDCVSTRQIHQCHNSSEVTAPQLSPIAIAPAIQAQGTSDRLPQVSLGSTSPDTGLPITPIHQNPARMDTYFSFDNVNFDLDSGFEFLDLSDTAGPGMMDFNMNNQFIDYLGSSNMMPDPNMVCLAADKAMMSLQEQFSVPPMPLPMLHISSDIEHIHPISPQICETSEQLGVFPFIDLVKEPEAVLSAQNFWPFFQCNESEKCFAGAPKTARIYLEGLSQTLHNPAAWPSWSVTSDSDIANDDIARRPITTKPLVDWSREKLLAITQSFLHKALEIHGGVLSPVESLLDTTRAAHGNFLMLPPPNMMQLFLQNYIIRYEPYYPSTAGANLDPNTLLQSSNDKAAALLILLMIASGAAGIPALEARFLSSGLTEACRLSLFDTVEKDVLQAKDVFVLRSALLFTCLAAWSGDKWHMDMAMGQRGLYLAMVSHSGILNASNSYLEMQSCRMNSEKAWNDWKEYEGQHRLAHSWIIFDQEISLFSDTVPLLSVVDLHTPIPDSIKLWKATSAGEWFELFEKLHGSVYQSPLSVRDLFTRFIEDNLAEIDVSPIHMRLLLHPLHAHISQLRQFLACLPETRNEQPEKISSRNTATASLSELDGMLEKWYAMCIAKIEYDCGSCWPTHANLIMYHLVSLNTMTSFRDIEQFARRDIVIEPNNIGYWLRMKCVDQRERVNVHCGQILRLIRLMPESVRPPWWAGAVYRAALILWATALAYGDSSLAEGTPKFGIDLLSQEHDTIVRYLKHKRGTAAISGSNGNLFSLDVPINALLCCAHLLSEYPGMRLVEGIWRKLHRLINDWM